MTATRFLRPALFVLALVLATDAYAQGHPHHHADSTAAHEHGIMMHLHERMAADTLIHQRMMADPELREAMAEMMGGAMDMEAMHERMVAMPPQERQARMDRMMEAHRRLMDDPVVRERMMANPEMHRMMREMMHGDEKHEMHRGRHDG